MRGGYPKAMWSASILRITVFVFRWDEYLLPNSVVIQSPLFFTDSCLCSCVMGTLGNFRVVATVLARSSQIKD